MVNGNNKNLSKKEKTVNTQRSTTKKYSVKSSVQPAKPPKSSVEEKSQVSSTSSPVQTPSVPNQINTNPIPDGEWTDAAPGMVFVSNSNKYYTSVKNPGNYSYVSQENAEASGASPGHGNGYAR